MPDVILYAYAAGILFFLVTLFAPAFAPAEKVIQSTRWYTVARYMILCALFLGTGIFLYSVTGWLVSPEKRTPLYLAYSLLGRRLIISSIVLSILSNSCWIVSMMIGEQPYRRTVMILQVVFNLLPVSFVFAVVVAVFGCVWK